MAKDDKNPPEEEHDDQGASPKEQLFEACRSNNLELLHELLESTTTGLDTFLNDSRNPLGQTALHVCVKHGNYEILDTLLDQEGLEVDPLSRMEDETPLHYAARHTSDDPDIGAHMVDLLVEAGADPR
ncbi:hypothetical protein AA313_de0204115 [Arthrobotrys entomopaga]|nr:hypothetical protein AA313_de0204115 [Arthrobotrys entomopaga]